MTRKKKHIFEGELREYEKKIINFFVEMSESKGQAPIFTTIAAYLLIHGDLTQAQLKELTGVSIGSISTTLNAMASIGYIEKKLIKGTHTFKYSLGGDLFQVASRTTMLKLEINEETTNFFREKMKELNEKGNQIKKGYEILSERIQGMMDFLKIHRKFIDKVPELIENIMKEEAPNRAI